MMTLHERVQPQTSCPFSLSKQWCQQHLLFNGCLAQEVRLKICHKMHVVVSHKRSCAWAYLCAFILCVHLCACNHYYQMWVTIITHTLDQTFIQREGYGYRSMHRRINKEQDSLSPFIRFPRVKKCLSTTHNITYPISKFTVSFVTYCHQNIWMVELCQMKTCLSVIYIHISHFSFYMKAAV